MLVSGVPALAGGLVNFLTPTNGVVATGGNYSASLQLTGSADPKTLKVTSGNLDVTNLFNPSGCSQTPCTLSATLTSTTGVLPGENYLTATVRGKNNGATDSSSQRFINGTSTIASLYPPHLVPIRQTGSTITVMTPTASTLDACPSPNIRIAVFNRMTLAPGNSGCFSASGVDAELSRYDRTNLIIVAAPYGSGNADFSKMGGNGDTSTNKPGYYGVGYGIGVKGSAFEAWQEAYDDGTHPKTINGNLVNMGCSSSMPACSQTPNAHFYAFQPTNAMGFAIVPGAAGTAGNPGLPTIYVGNPSRVPVNGTTPSNQVRPKVTGSGNGELFTYQTYRPQWTGGNAAGGFYLVVLNRSDLTKRSETLYVTNGGPNDNAAIQQLSVDIDMTFPNDLFLLTTVGIPFNVDTNIAPLTNGISRIGGNTYALQGIAPDRLGNPARAGFSIVAYLRHPDAELVPTRLYSTAANTQQGETGALRGIFAKGTTAYYEAKNVNSFDLASLPTFATGDDYLSHALSASLASTEPVAWPQMDTAGKRSAYQYLSKQLLAANLGLTGDCGLTCYDVRYYYTGIDAPTLFNKLQPNQVTFSSADASTQNYTSGDFQSVQAQLQQEAIYLGDVVNLQSYTAELNTNADLNVGSALRIAGNAVTTDLEQTLKVPSTTTSNTSVGIASDVFNTLGAISSIPGVFFPPMGVVAGVCSVTANILNIFHNESQQTVTQTPSPYLTQLEQLTAKDTVAAESATTKFANDQMNAMGTFYNGVYSDWFRLQSVALLSLDQGAGGWYIADKDTARTQYLQTLSVTMRANLWQQILPQYFTLGGYSGVATAYHKVTEGTDDNTTFSNFLSRYNGPNPNLKLSDFTYYSWDHRTSTYGNACEDYVFLFTNNEWGTPWPNEMGSMLFGNGTSADGLTSQLNLDRNWVYDQLAFPLWAGHPVTVTDQTHGNHNISWRCTDHPWPFGASGMVGATFAGIPASRTIVKGSTGTITLYGTIQGAGSHSAVRPKAGTAVQLSVGDITASTTTSDANGNFSTDVNIADLPASPTAYTITYAFAGTGQGEASGGNGLFAATDSSTSLTVLSTTTEATLTVNGTDVTYPAQTYAQVVLKSPAGAPVGTVNLLDNATIIATQTMTAADNGVAKTWTLNLEGGQHQLSVQFAGQNPFGSAVSNTVSVNVRPADSYLSINSLGSVPGGTQNVTVAASVRYDTNSPAPAGGLVTASLGSMQRSTTTNPDGSFSVDLPIAGLVAGQYTVNVAYQGTASIASFNRPVSLQITKLHTEFVNLLQYSMTAGDKTPIVLQSSLTKSGSLTPSGTVYATVIARPSGTVVTTTNKVNLVEGTFSITLDTSTIPATPASYFINYIYSGDDNFNSWNDAATSVLTVSAPVTTMTFSSSAPAADYGTNVTFTAAVSANNVKPSGNVIFKDGDTQLASVALDANAQATYKTSSLSVGTHTITANYDGGSGAFGLSSASLTQTINKATTSTSLTTSAAAPTDFGSPVTFTALTVAGQQPVADGRVEFYDGSALLGSAPVGNGQASFTTSSLAVGVRSISAAYKPLGTLDASSTSSNVSVTIAPLAVGFNGLTPSQSVADGTATVAVAGRIGGTIAPQTKTASVLQFTQLTTGDSNGGATFSGMPNASQISTNNATYGVWIKTTAQTKQMIFQGSDYRPFIYMQGDKLGVIFKNAGPEAGWLSADTRPISDGLWHHVLVTFNNGAITIYKDGVATADKFAVTQFWAATNYMNLGASWGDVPGFVGSMWNAQIWNQSFTSVDVGNTMYRTYGANNPNLVLQTAFNADANTVVNASNGAAGSFSLSTIAKDEVPAMSGGIANLTDSYNDNSGSGLRLFAADSSNLSTDHATYSVWVKTTAKTQQMLIGAAAYHPFIYMQGDQVGVLYPSAIPDAGWLSTDTTPISDGRWHQITVTFDMGKIMVYKDGAPTVDSTSVTSPTAVAGAPYVILAGSYNNIPSFVGQMWNAKTWSRALSAADIATDMFKVYDDGNATPDLQAQSWFDGHANSGKNSVNGSPITVLRAATTVAPLPSSYPVANAEVSISTGSSSQKATTGANGAFSASLSTASLQPGSYPVQYSYAGSANLKLATNSSTTLTIGNAASAFTNLLPSPTVTLGTASVTLGGTITAGAAIPTGNVRISVNGVTGNAPIQADGSFSASIDTSALPVGTYPVTFDYAGNSSFSPVRNSTDRTVTVTLASSTTTLTSSANPADAGVSVRFTATVASGNATPTGSVTFYSDGAPISAAIPLTAGSASFSTNALTGGTHAITASYDGGNGAFGTSSGALSQTINKLTPYFTVLSASQTIGIGAPPVTLGGTIASDSLVPTGAVSITVNGVNKTAAIQPDGKFSATIDASAFPVDTYSVIYTYASNDTFNTVRDTTTTKLTVQNIVQATSVAVISSAATSQYADTVTFTATVTAASGTPGGTVTFYDGATQIGTASLNAGVGTLSTNNLVAGSHQVTATYTPSSQSFSPATSPAFTQIVTTLQVKFSNLTASQSVPYGTTSVTFGGKLSGISSAGSGGVANFTESYNDQSGSGIRLNAADASGLSTDKSTYSVWIKTTAKTQQMLLAGGDIRPFIYMQGDQLGVMFRGAGPDAGWLSTDVTPISDGRWHQITVTFDKGKITLYKDGVPTADNFAVTTYWASTSYVILSGSWSGIPSFVGQMWNVKIWSRALNAAEIGADMFQVYAAGTGTPDLQVQSSFDAAANTGKNTVDGGAATILRAGTAASALPAAYPVANDQVSIAVGSSSRMVTTDSQGNFTLAFPSSTIPAGSNPVKYGYLGNTNIQAANDSGTTLIITSLASTTSLSSSLNPSTTGGEVTFTATVTGGTSSTTPTGTVTFKDGSTTLGSVSLTNGVAAFKTSALTVGAHSITAVYSGDTNFGTNTSTALTQTVNAATSTTTVASSLNPSTSGAEVTFTATVAVGSGTPTGTVTFSDGVTTLGTSPLTSSVATFKTSALKAGAHSITAVYSGDTNFGTSTSAALTQTVNAATSTTALTSSLNPSTSGAEVTFTATVTVASGSPTGNVTFKDGATTLGTSSLTGGVATFKTSALTVGSHSITAVYSGDTNFGASTSTVLSQTVNAATSTTALTSSLNPSTSGAEVTFTATVTVASGSPTGNVTFKDGAITLGTASLTGGIATFKTSALTVGSHSITAIYSGDTNFGNSMSSALTQTVNAAASTTTVASSPNPSTSGAEITFTATVTVVSGSPTGTVMFRDGNTTLGSAPLISGVATFKTSALTVGSHSITAVYSGDTNFGTSTSSALTQTVNGGGPVQSVVVLTATPNPVNFGQTVTFTAKVTQVGGIVPTGNVTISETTDANGNPLPAVVIYGNADLVDGVATIVVDSTIGAFSKLTAGTHILFATYGGDGNVNYTGATSMPYKLDVKPELGAEAEKAVLKITAANARRTGETVTVDLKIENTGNAASYDTTLTQIAVRTLTGTGNATVVTPLPINAGMIAPKGSITKTVTLNVPAAVTRISLTETGTLRDVSTPSATFSLSQMLILN